MANLSRCRSIAIKLLHTSSLPSLSMDFHGSAPALTSLILQAKFDNIRPRDVRPVNQTGFHSDMSVSSPNIDAHQTTPPWLASRSLTPFYTPNLNHIDINGRNFANACLYIPTWLASWNSQANISLRLSTFRPVDTCPVDNSFTANDLIACLRSIPHLDCLMLCDVAFTLGTTDPGICELDITRLAWTGLSGHFFDTIRCSLAFNKLGWAYIGNCELVGPWARSTSALFLKDNDTESLLIQEFLWEWEGVRLFVVNCPGFDDAVPDTLGESNYPGDWCLCFENCVNLTSDGLCRLLDRITSSDEHICRVIVQGHPETLSEDKLERLRELLYIDSVGSWNGVPILGQRPMPDSD